MDTRLLTNAQFDAWLAELRNPSVERGAKCLLYFGDASVSANAETKVQAACVLGACAVANGIPMFAKYVKTYPFGLYDLPYSRFLWEWNDKCEEEDHPQVWRDIADWLEARRAEFVQA